MSCFHRCVCLFTGGGREVGIRGGWGGIRGYVYQGGVVPTPWTYIHPPPPVLASSGGYKRALRILLECFPVNINFKKLVIRGTVYIKLISVNIIARYKRDPVYL